MTQLSVNQRRWSRFGLLFVAAILLYAMLTFLGWVMGAVVVKRFPENYEWQVRSAMRKGNLEVAERIARNRVQDEHYDFSAHRLLATVLLKKGDAAEAVDVLSMSLDRMKNATGREVYTRGADPAATYELLSTALQQKGNHSFANETARIAQDYRSNSLMGEGSGKPGISNTETSASVANPLDAVQLALDKLDLNGGVALTTSGTLTFTGSGTAKASLEASTPASPSEILISVSGGKALGMGSILKVSINDQEIFQVYASSVVPRWVSIPVEKELTQASLPLTLEFINDAYDPVTKADRNVEVHQLRIR